MDLVRARVRERGVTKPGEAGIGRRRGGKRKAVAGPPRVSFPWSRRCGLQPSPPSPEPYPTEWSAARSASACRPADPVHRSGHCRQADYCGLCWLLRRAHGPCGAAQSGSVRTPRRPPEVRPTAFAAHLPDLPPRALMALDFAVIGPLVRPGRPRIRFLSIRSRLCSTLPSDPASQRRPCASLILRRHQAG